MTKLYNADSAKNYEPLTDDEKSQMSDSEVEKWETKIKDSLLRRDSNLSTIMNAMTISMTKAISINGKNYSLSSFGIVHLVMFKMRQLMSRMLIILTVMRMMKIHQEIKIS